MSTFVLVHGAWGGAWIWRRILGPLRGAGHEVHAVTLTGDGERAHLRRADISLHRTLPGFRQIIAAPRFEISVLTVLPAKAVRTLSEEDVARLQASAASYVKRGQLFKAELKRIG